MNGDVKAALDFLETLLKSGSFNKLIIKTRHGTETFTPSKASTVDRLVTVLEDELILALAAYLKNWNVRSATVEIDFTRTSQGLPFHVTWREGVWLDGVWVGGDWLGGVWNNGVWLNGVWHEGVWKNGIWEDGVWLGGQWLGGQWKSGVFDPKKKFERDQERVRTTTTQ